MDGRVAVGIAITAGVALALAVTSFVAGRQSGQAKAEIAMAARDEKLGSAISDAVAATAIDAETKAALASDKPQVCVDAPKSPACMMVTCWRYQQGDAGRSDAGDCARWSAVALDIAKKDAGIE